MSARNNANLPRPSRKELREIRATKQEMHSVCLLVFIFSMCCFVHPTIIPYLHALFYPFLILVRVFRYATTNRRWYLLDAVYLFHLLLIAYFLLLPFDNDLFSLCWTFSVGYCTIASFVWQDRVSLSLPPFFSFYVRFMPSLVMYNIKYYNLPLMQSEAETKLSQFELEKSDANIADIADTIMNPLSSVNIDFENKEYLESILDISIDDQLFEPYFGLMNVAICLVCVFIIQYLLISLLMPSDEQQVSFRFLAKQCAKWWQMIQNPQSYLKNSNRNRNRNNSNTGNAEAGNVTGCDDNNRLLFLVVAAGKLWCVCVGCVVANVLFSYGWLHLLVLFILFSLGCYRGFQAFVEDVRSNKSKKRR